MTHALGWIKECAILTSACSFIVKGKCKEDVQQTTRSQVDKENFGALS